MKEKIKILLIEDDTDDVLFIKEYFNEIDSFDFQLDWEANSEIAKVKLIENNHDICLVDYNLGRTTGIALIKYMRSEGVLTPAILLTGLGDSTIDTDASAAGAFDYLTKSELSPALLERSIRYAIAQSNFLKELNEKEKKYRSLFEKSLDAIFLATTDLRMIDLNDSFFKLFGYTQEDKGRLKIKDIFANPADYEYCKVRLKEVEYVKDFEVALITKEGVKRLCLLNCVFIPNQNDDFCCYQGIICDLTLRKKAESDMLIAERLAMTGNIARTIAHEVRNPLTNINLALEQLKDEVPEGSETIKVYSEIIERNSSRIEALIGDLLKSSKPRELQLELAPINRIVEETIPLAKDRINLRSIKLSTTLDGNLPMLLLDIEKIKLAVLNILINAIEAMDKSEGKLIITTFCNDNYVCLSIEDNGKGIEQEHVSKLFDPFFTGKVRGTGLGLTATRNIISSHNGDIKVNSMVGEGTTFTLSFKIPS